MTNKLGLPDDRPCGFCGEHTDSLAGNPGRWPLFFTHPDGTGVVKAHHVGCVTERLFPRWKEQVEVEQGSVWVNSLWIAAQSPTTLVIEGDLRAKYATVLGLMSPGPDSSEKHEIMLGATERTLNCASQLGPTYIKLALPKGWEIDADICRYTLRIFTFKRERDGAYLWCPEQK